MKKRSRVKIAIVLFIVSSLILFGVSIYTSFIMQTLSSNMTNDIERRLVATSKLATFQVTADELEQLQTKEDMNTPLFKDIRDRLVAFANEEKILYAYFIRIDENGDMQYIIDNDLTDETVNLSTPPLPMEDAPQTAFNGTATTTSFGNYTLGYDGLLSAFAPVFDNSGNVVAIAGIDITDDQVLSLRAYTNWFAIILIVAMILVLSTGILTFNLFWRSEKDLNNRFKQQVIMSEISLSFLSNEDISIRINDALRKIGKFLNVSRVLFSYAVYNSDASTNNYAWVSDSSVPTPERIEGFDELIDSVFPKSVPEDLSNLSVCCDDTSKDGKFNIIKNSSVKAFIWAPIYVFDEYWGLVGIDDCTKTREWTESDEQLAAIVASAISGAITRDSMERRRTEALEEARKASQAKGDFLANMSHEMRTPMNAIIGMTKIAISSEDPERIKYGLSRIDEASNHLLGVINDILDMSKIEANKFELSNVTFSFSKVIQNVKDVIQFRVDEKKQTFSIEIDENIPEYFIGDSQRLSQVIMNLITNAVKFTPEKGTIALKAKTKSIEGTKHTLYISVSDSGIGISDEQKAKLFKSFEQADSSTSRKFGGTGLGLAISKHIIEMMGGSIDVESELNCGSVFSFTVVLELGDGTQITDRQITFAEMTKADSFGDKRILLAEDVEINIEILVALLENTGVEIIAVHNGLEAVNEFSENPDNYDLILMDIQMPEMDGYEATRKIRALPIEWAKRIPIIAMTANVFQEDINKSIEAGMNGHLGKPINFDELRRTLKLYLED